MIQSHSEVGDIDLKKFLVFTILIVTASSLAPAQTTNDKVAPGTSLQMEITKIEEEWHSALTKHDAALLDRILADEFISVGGNGKSQNKTETIASLKKSEAVYEYFTPYDLDVRQYGNTVVVVGRSKSKGQYPGGNQFMSEYRWTDVFVKRDGRWQCVAAQVTPVPVAKPN